MEVRIRNRFVQVVPAKDSHLRRVVQSQNKIVQTLKRLGCSPDGVSFSSERIAMRKAEAWVRFYGGGEQCYISCNALSYADNMQAIAQLIVLEEESVERGEESLATFFDRYREEGDEDADRKEAREILGVPQDCKDWKVIDKAYKDLARSAHPDMGGSEEFFKKLNKAHKILKKECATLV